MRTALVFLALLCVMCNTVVHSLKCYKCYSSVSWRKCDNSRKEVTCPSGLDTCGYVHAVSEHEIFARDCESRDRCRTLCKGSKYKTCTAKCCHSDLCNGKRLGTPPTLPGVTKSPTSQTPQSTSKATTRNSPLSCYTCESRYSWIDCDKNTYEVTCPVAMDTCVKLSVGSLLYKRSCGTSERCHVAQVNCNRAQRLSEDFECQVKCCSGTLCNSCGVNTSSCRNVLFIGGFVAAVIKMIT